MFRIVSFWHVFIDHATFNASYHLHTFSLFYLCSRFLKTKPPRLFFLIFVLNTTFPDRLIFFVKLLRITSLLITLMLGNKKPKLTVLLWSIRVCRFAFRIAKTQIQIIWFRILVDLYRTIETCKLVLLVVLELRAQA